MYNVLDLHEEFIPKLKCKGASFKGDFCRYVPSKNKVNHQEFNANNDLLSLNPYRLFDEIVANKESNIVCHQFKINNIKDGKGAYGI
jgi:hypothetical protein